MDVVELARIILGALPKNTWSYPCVVPLSFDNSCKSIQYEIDSVPQQATEPTQENVVHRIEDRHTNRIEV